MTALIWNPLDPAFTADPYPTYRYLREQDPMQDLGIGRLILSRHADIEQVLRDQSASVEDRRSDPAAEARRAEIRAELGLPPFDPTDRSMLMMDPPDHTRLRRIVQGSFTPRKIAQRRDIITEVVDAQLDRLAELRGTIDLIAEYAFPIPFLVICHLLGLPADDMDDIREWSRDLTQGLEPTFDDGDFAKMALAGQKLRQYLAGQVESKRANPDGALLSELIEVESEGDRMSERELLTMLVLLFVAGHETTVNLIGNGTLALLRHPEQADRLRASTDPRFDAAATDELLRYDSPVQTTGRMVTRDMDLSGGSLAAGQSVICALGAANRDEQVFGDDADQLRLDRDNADRHMSFSSGNHFCLGASLARNEGEIAIGRLLRRFPDLAPATDEADWSTRIVLRGLRTLPITLG